MSTQRTGAAVWASAWSSRSKNAVIGRKMKDSVYTVHGGTRDSGLAQIGVYEIDLAAS